MLTSLTHRSFINIKSKVHHLVIVVRQLEHDVVVDVDVENVVVLLALENGLAAADRVAALVWVRDHVAHLAPLSGR